MFEKNENKRKEAKVGPFKKLGECSYVRYAIEQKTMNEAVQTSERIEIENEEKTRKIELIERENLPKIEITDRYIKERNRA